MSWNKIGSSKECIQALAVGLKTNTTLHHLDISHNSIGLDELQVLGEGLRQNHTLMGLHIVGNEGVLDADGHLHKFDISAEGDRATGLLKSQSCNLLRTSLVQSEVNRKLLCSCWICEEWVPYEVLLTTNLEGRKIKANINADDFVKGKKLNLVFEKRKIEDPVFVHFEFDHFRPW